jgi:hypothetical protein
MPLPWSTILYIKKVFRRKKDQYDRRKCVITIAPEAAKIIEYMELDHLFPFKEF